MIDLVDLVRERLLGELVVPEAFELQVDWAFSYGDIDVVSRGGRGGLQPWVYIVFTAEAQIVLDRVVVWQNCEGGDHMVVLLNDPEFLVKVQGAVVGFLPGSLDDLV